MKPSELFKSSYDTAIDEGGPYGKGGGFDYAVSSSGEDGVLALKIVALLEAVEGSRLMAMRENPKDIIIADEDVASILRAALALKEE